MKKMYLLGLGLFLMIVAQAQNNQELILGYWATDSLGMTMGMLIQEEDVEEMMVTAEFLTEEQFLEFFGFPMPQSEEEWEQLIGTVVYSEEFDEVDITLAYVYFTETHMILYDDGEAMELLYSFENDSTLSVTYTGEDDFPFTQFVINELTEDNLILYAEGGFDVEQMMLTIYSTSVDEVVSGCTDEVAENYNSEAIIDDGSCEYGFMCGSNELQLTMYDEAEDGWEGTELVINGVAYTLNDGEMGVECVELADCYMFSTVFGGFMFEAYWELSDEDGVVSYSGSLPFEANDEDEDLVCDGIDNCAGVYNPDQFDTDEDGEGDVCDYDDGLNIEEINKKEVELVKMIDVLGREYKEHTNGKVLFYLYSNGEVKKKYKL